MLSRVADAIYWSSRYVERAENVARFIDVNLNLMLDTPVGRRVGWESLVLTTGDQDRFYERYSEATPSAVAHFLTFDTEYPNSVLSSLTKARDNVRTVREVISREMWQQLNEFYLMVREASQQPFSLSELASFYQRVKMSGIYYEGVTNATLSRGEAWSFARLGRMFERADKTSRILDVKYYLLLPSVREVGTTVDQVGWVALLNSASALQMYRQHHHVTSPAAVARFLMLNLEFPRSILYCISAAQTSLHGITGTPINVASNEPERLLGMLRARLAYARIEELMAEGLHEVIDQIQTSLNEIGAATQRQFFDLGT
jgi:uncharacterized alpha-E superfamily protein